MITIVHLISSLEHGGAQMMLWKLLSQMDRQRFRNIVVCAFDEGPLAEPIRAIGIPVMNLGVWRGPRAPGTARRLARLMTSPVAAIRLMRVLRQVDPNVVVTWGYFVDLLGLLGATVTRVPVIWTAFSSFNPFLGQLFLAINKLSIRLSRFPAAVVTDSEAARTWHYQLGYRPKEWQVIPMGFDIDQFRPDESARLALRQELGLPSDAIVVGLVGRFNLVKGHETFLTAAGLLGRRRPDLYFALIGPGVTSENPLVREWVDASGVSDRVFLLGERPDIPSVTAALDVATCSSYGESFPNVVGEAMACGVPCVVTDVGDAASMVGDTGLVVPSRDVQGLATAWQELIDLGAAGRQALGARARRRVEENYSLHSIVRQYEELCARVAGQADTIARPS
jgi:glycosyltransferase involved in cell wall biosynthesis